MQTKANPKLTEEAVLEALMEACSMRFNSMTDSAVMTKAGGQGTDLTFRIRFNPRVFGPDEEYEVVVRRVED